MVLLKPSPHRKKSVVRAIRLTEELDQALVAEAELKGITPGSLISSIFTKYVQFDSTMERMGSVQMPQQWLMYLLDAASDENLRKVAPMMGEELRSRIEFTFGQFNLDSLLEALENAGSYSRLFRIEIRTDQKRFNATFYHTYGKKWSEFLENAVVGLMEQLPTKILSHSSTNASVVISGERP